LAVVSDGIRTKHCLQAIAKEKRSGEVMSEGKRSRSGVPQCLMLYYEGRWWACRWKCDVRIAQLVGRGTRVYKLLM